MSNDMIERVARATYFAGEGIGIQGAFDPRNDAHWAHWWKEDRELHEAIARAAIEAMREPTAAMTIAGDQAYRACGGGPVYSGCDGSTCCHRAMIDEALKGRPA